MCVESGIVTHVRVKVRDLKFESHIPHFFLTLYVSGSDTYRPDD